MQQDITDVLSQFDTCILADALDRIGLQMHNKGFTSPGLQCFTARCGSFVGYAATARVRASDPPMTGHRKTGHMYFRHTAWWQEISRMPSPRLIVIEDIDRRAGSGSCMGKIGAAVFSALHCVGAITNGAVLEIEDVSSTGFGLFAGHLSPARAYAHLVDHSSTVVINGLTISPGDLLAADRHGVLSIPPEALPKLAEIALEIQERKRTFVSFCQSSEFSLETMESRLEQFQL
jgi:4-hydroxy-4-methyl-2-oxoglutarate aldolase